MANRASSRLAGRRVSSGMSRNVAGTWRTSREGSRYSPRPLQGRELHPRKALIRICWVRRAPSLLRVVFDGAAVSVRLAIRGLPVVQTRFAIPMRMKAAEACLAASAVGELEEVQLSAHRQAGQAVVALLCHVPLKQVALGTPTIPSFRLLRGMGQQHARGIVGLAGGEAEHRYLAHRFHSYRTITARSNVARYALDLMASPAVAEALVALWEVQAREFVEARWPDIKRVAVELLVSETLTRAEVRRIARER